MKHKLYPTKIRPGMFILITSFFGMIQFQNCAQPVNQVSQSSDPAYVASPIVGSNKNGVVNVNDGQGKLFFAASSIDLSPESQVLRPGGICSLPADASPVHWQLLENAENSLVVYQGAESCDHGSFYVNLSAQISLLACEKSYVLSATLSGGGAAQVAIVKHCSGVASN